MFAIFRANFEWDIEDGTTALARQKPVGFEQLWNHDAEFLYQLVNVTCLSGESGNVVARGNPDLGFRVPESIHYVWATFHQSDFIISADPRGLSTNP